MSFFIAEAAAQAQTAAPPSTGADYGMLIMMGGMFVFMYFLIIRPQRKRAKEHQSLVDSLTKGNEVVLNSGMIGKITDVDDSYVTIKAGEGVELKFQKAAVHAVLPKGTLKAI